MEKIYKISCVALAVVAVVALAVTVYVGATGVSPVAGRVGLIVVIVCLSAVALITVIGTVFIPAGGSFIHKIGHYVMHLGAVVLIVGFIVTELSTVTNTRTYTDAAGAEVPVKGDLLTVGRDYDSIPVGKREFVRTGAWFSLESVGFEQYEDGTPRRYEATVVLKDKKSGLVIEEKTLTVNHPQYVDGYKIYLMNVTANNSGAVLYIKYNPAEYVVLIGIAATVFGTFLSCFTALLGKKACAGSARKEKTEGKDASDTKGGDPV